MSVTDEKEWCPHCLDEPLDTSDPEAWKALCEDHRVEWLAECCDQAHEALKERRFQRGLRELEAERRRELDP